MIMRVRLWVFIFLVSTLKSLCEATGVGLQFQDRGLYRIARSVADATAFTIEYTLITANSPDCEPSLINDYPVRVQYRTIIGGGDGRGQNNSVSEWMDSMDIPGTRGDRLVRSPSSLY